VHQRALWLRQSVRTHLVGIAECGGGLNRIGSAGARRNARVSAALRALERTSPPYSEHLPLKKAIMRTVVRFAPLAVLFLLPRRTKAKAASR
jgi:hypothetical protein